MYYKNVYRIIPSFLKKLGLNNFVKLSLKYLFVNKNWIYLLLQKLTLSDGGEIFNLWSQPPVDLYLKVYLFNITNAAAFMEGREKMHVEQVGPYVYK